MAKIIKTVWAKIKFINKIIFLNFKFFSWKIIFSNSRKSEGSNSNSKIRNVKIQQGTLLKILLILIDFNIQVVN